MIWYMTGIRKTKMANRGYACLLLTSNRKSIYNADIYNSGNTVARQSRQNLCHAGKFIIFVEIENEHKQIWKPYKYYLICTVSKLAMRFISKVSRI